MTTAQYNATRRLLGNRMSKRDTEKLVAMLNIKTDDIYRRITLSEYITENPDKVIRRWASKKGNELIDVVNPYGDIRTYEMSRADTQMISLLIKKERTL